MPIAHFHDALVRGSTAKIIQAAQAGQDMHPVLPANLGRPGERLSPLTLARHWPWERKPELCLRALKALLDAGADPNRPDGLGRVPLHLLVWLRGEDLPAQVFDLFAAAGADLHMRSFTSRGRDDLSLLDICILNHHVQCAHRLLDVDPSVAKPRCPKNPEVKGVPFCPSVLSTLKPSVVSAPSSLSMLVGNHQQWSEEEGAGLVARLLLLGANHEVTDENRVGLTHSPGRVGQWVRAGLAELKQQELEKQWKSATAKGNGPRL